MKRLTTLLRPRWVLVVVMALSVATLVRTGMYYGSLYHGWDAQFYYSLADSILFDGDTDITNNLRLTPYPGPFDPRGDGSWTAAPYLADGRIASKYPIGMSLIELPWISIGHLFRGLAERVWGPKPAASGYSTMEIWFVALGLVVIFAFGLAQLYVLLAESFGRWAAALGLLGCWTGTSLFYYSAVFPFMTHACSFTLLALAMRFTRDLLSGSSPNRTLALLGGCIAAIFLLRPQQVIIVLFLSPLIFKELRGKAPKEWTIGALAATLVGIVAIIVTVWVNYLQFGVLTLNGYAMGQESFHWLKPQLAVVLLSSSRGLLFFSPIVAIAAWGHVAWPRSVPRWVWPFVGNAAAQLYLIAAWSSPDQGDAFGARMWSDNTAVVAFGLALLFYRASRAGRMAEAISVAMSIGWSITLLFRYIYRM
jgi:hypothetical protein